MFSLCTRPVVTRKHNIREIPIHTWVIQIIEYLAACNRTDLDDGDEPLFVERFSKQNDLSAALHQGSITGVVQDDDQVDYKNNDNTDEIQEPARNNEQLLITNLV